MIKQNTSNKKLVIALIIFLVLLFLMCFAALRSTYNDSVDPEDYDTDPPAINEEDINDGLAPATTSIDTDFISDWKSYENTDSRIKFMYPPELEVTVDVDYGISNLNMTTIDIVNKRDNYILRIRDIYQGGTICQFNDATQQVIVGPGTTITGEGKELVTKLEGAIRRNSEPIQPGNYWKDGEVEYVYSYLICKDRGVLESDPEGKHNYSNAYQTEENIYTFTYWFVDLPELEQVQLLDRIFSTIEVY